MTRYTFALIILIFVIHQAKTQTRFDPARLPNNKVYGPIAEKEFTRHEVYQYTPTDKPGTIHLKNGLRKTTYESPEKWTRISDTVNVDSIDIVFSKYPLRADGYHMHYDLLCNRLVHLFEIDELLNDPNIKFRMILQTHCTSDAQVGTLFHGAAIHYSPINKKVQAKTVEQKPKTIEEVIAENNKAQTREVSMKEAVASIEKIPDLPVELKNLLKNKSVEEKASVMVNYFEEKLKNNTYEDTITQAVLEKYEEKAHEFIDRYNYSKKTKVLDVFARHPEWKKALVVADWTGSMYAYGAQALLWHVTNFEKSYIKYFTLFNDGDMTRDADKIIGETGGIYHQEANRIGQIVDLYNLVMLKGGGGDGPENNLEAVIKGIHEFPDHGDVIMIADNFACVKDMQLLGQIKEPVRIIVCGAAQSEGVNPQLLEIAAKTGGSVHTMEDDLYNLLMEEETGKKITSLEAKKVKIGFSPCGLRYEHAFLSKFDTATFYNLNIALEEHAHAVRVDLSDQARKRFPKRVSQLENLEHLSLANNNLKGLPRNSVSMQKIRTLNLSNNRIEEIPEWIDAYPNLYSLDLSYNKLTEANTAVFNIHYLNYLDLSHNDLKTISPVFNCAMLEYLYLAENNLTEIPRNIAKLKNLKELSLASNKLKVLPVNIMKLKNLEVLDLSNNRFTGLPKSLKGLKKLKVLRLTGNKLSDHEVEELRKAMPWAKIDFQAQNH
ncbi:MAG TPA: leucine-rich repeat domain-containing protein [Flavobacteriales bacterium]|nr:leucine-rich repeat domain-containing protein [Flavobacteriales bacterium]